MALNKPKNRNKNVLDASSSVSESEDTQKHAEEMSCAEGGSSQVSHTELSALIRSIMREEFEAAFDKRLKPQLDALKGEIKSCSQKLGEIEKGLTDVDRRVSALEAANVNLIKENRVLKDKMERLEMHSRKRVFGLKHDIEKSDPNVFMTNLFKEVFKGELKYDPVVDIANRIGPVIKSRPRPMIVRMQSYQAKEAILKLARKKREVIFQDMRVKIYPDITQEAAKKRAEFNNVREKLRKAEVRHGLLFPATLIATFNGQTKLFRDCMEAETFYEKEICPAIQAGKDVTKD